MESCFRRKSSAGMVDRRRFDMVIASQRSTCSEGRVNGSTQKPSARLNILPMLLCQPCWELTRHDERCSDSGGSSETARATHYLSCTAPDCTRDLHRSFRCRTKSSLNP